MDIIKEKVKLARTRKGYSLRKLAEILEVTHTTVAKIEKGLLNPNSNLIIKLAKALEVKAAYFFRKPKVPVNITNINYRKRSRFPKKNVELIENITLEALQDYFELKKLFPKERFCKISLEDLKIKVNSYEEIEKKAIEIRKKFNLGNEPITELLEVLEENGLLVFLIDDYKDFDGKSALANGEPFIVLADNKSGDRQRFNLAHELAHLIIEHDNLDDEKVANYFAGAFLITKESLIKELGRKRQNLTIFELKELKKKYKVSMQSIIYRAKQLGIIVDKEYERLYKIFSYKGWRKKEPIEIGKEKSSKFFRMVFEAVSEKFISVSKGAEYLNMSTQDFMAKYMGEGVCCYNI